MAKTTLQLAAKPEMRGRVMALWALAWLGSTPIGGPIVGWVGQAVGARWSLVIGGLPTLVCGILALPALTTYTNTATNNDQYRTLQASGAGSVLDLHNVTHIGNGTAYAFTAAGSTNQLLTSGGAGTPTFQNISSLLTAGTNIMTVAIMYFLGGQGIHGFTFVLLVGILVGTYSSIAIASPILLVGRKQEEEATGPARGQYQRAGA